MTRTELLKNINYALNHIQYGAEKEKEIKAAFKKLKKDLKFLELLRKEIKATIKILEATKTASYKLESVINILKDTFKYELGVSFVGDKYHYSLEFLFNNQYFSITKEEYELLKEVLNND